MILAKELIRTIIVGSGTDKNEILKNRKFFLVEVLNATVKDTQIDGDTGMHLRKILDDVVDGAYDKRIVDWRESTRWAMEIATWLHSVHAVLKNNTPPL